MSCRATVVYFDREAVRASAAVAQTNLANRFKLDARCHTGWLPALALRQWRTSSPAGCGPVIARSTATRFAAARSREVGPGGFGVGFGFAAAGRSKLPRKS